MRPQYIVCSESGSQDKDSNLMSLFNVIEKITIRVSDEDAKQLPRKTIVAPIRLFALAVWIKEDGDEGKEFETWYTIQAPGKPAKDFSKVPFSVTLAKHLQRCKFVFEGPAFFHENGIMRIANHIQQVGTDDVRTQEYTILVESNASADQIPTSELADRP